MDVTAEQLREDSEIEHTIDHEAGHAVAGHVLGLPFDRIEVWKRDGGMGGACHFRDLDEKTEAAAIMSAAGAAAAAEARRLLAEHNRRAQWRDDLEAVAYLPIEAELSPDDIGGVRSYLRANAFMSGPGVQREIGRIQAEARRVILANWPLWHAVATALTERATRAGAYSERGGDWSIQLDRADFLKVIEVKGE